MLDSTSAYIYLSFYLYCHKITKLNNEEREGKKNEGCCYLPLFAVCNALFVYVLVLLHRLICVVAVATTIIVASQAAVICLNRISLRIQPHAS